MKFGSLFFSPVNIPTNQLCRYTTINTVSFHLSSDKSLGSYNTVTTVTVQPEIYLSILRNGSPAERLL